MQTLASRQQVRVRLLGGCSLQGPAGTVLSDPSNDLCALLGLLAEHRSVPVQRVTAYARLWPDFDPAIDRETFWRPMRDARARLGEVLGGNLPGSKLIEKVGRSGYRVNTELVGFDVWELRDVLIEARTASPECKPLVLGRAADLYTGTFLAGSGHEFVIAAARALDREVVTALAQLAELLEQTEPDQAALYLERATGVDPTAEHLFRQRMAVYGRQGRLADIHACMSELADQLATLDMKPALETVAHFRRLTCST